MAIPETLKKLQLKFQIRKDAVVAGTKFTLQVLSFKDEQRVQSLPTDGIDGITFFNEMQKGLLSHAIRAIDGEEVPETVEIDGPNGTKVSKERPIYMREVLDGLPATVIENLFQIYVDIRDEKEQEISSSVTYHWYKTPEQREEERKKKEAEEQAKKEAEEKAKKEAESKKAEGAAVPPAGKEAVPSPDAEVNLKKLPNDYSDVEDKTAKAR